MKESYRKGIANRPEKGQGRKASTNVKEESDCAVLPMKLANKATEQEPEAAELVEGRAQGSAGEKAGTVPNAAA